MKLIHSRTMPLKRSRAAVSEDVLALINRQYAIRELSAADVAVYTITVCNDQPDHYNTQFRVKALETVREKIVGKGLFRNHNLWQSGDLPMGLGFDARLSRVDGVTGVEVDTFIPRCADTDGIIARMDAGVINEVSLQWWSYPVECSICGLSPYDDNCPHAMGKEYDGRLAVGEIPDVHDVVEFSLVWKGGQVNTKIEGKRAEDVEMAEHLGELMMRCAQKHAAIDELACLFERQETTPGGLDSLFARD